MINFSSRNSLGKYDLLQTEVWAATYDERRLLDQQDEFNKVELIRDLKPHVKSFSPFKYTLFIIPLFRYPVVDMLSIFIPIWLLSFMSVYIFYETTEIMNRIMNVSALMIAYAAIMPIVRENLPDVTGVTLVDILIYLELLVNVFFLVRSIELTGYDDDV